MTVLSTWPTAAAAGSTCSTRTARSCKEGVFAPWTIVQGSAWDIELSRDTEQQWLFAADGANMKVWILRREDMEVVGSFGHGGRQAGQFNWVHNITADSFGNLYTAEVNTGKRVQKFVPVATN